MTHFRISATTDMIWKAPCTFLSATTPCSTLKRVAPSAPWKHGGKKVPNLPANCRQRQRSAPIRSRLTAHRPDGGCAQGWFYSSHQRRWRHPPATVSPELHRPRGKRPASSGIAFEITSGSQGFEGIFGHWLRFALRVVISTQEQPW